MKCISEIKETIEAMGIEVAEVTVFKNGADKVAFALGDGDVRPNVYPENLIQANMSEEEVQEYVKSILSEHSMADDFANDCLEKLNDAEFVKVNIYIGLCPASSNHKLECRPSFLDESVVEYLYVRLGEFGKGMAMTTIFKDSNIPLSVSELWAYAEANTNAETEYMDLMERLGAPFTVGWNNPEKTIVLTNRTNTRGAACVTNRAVLAEIASKFDTDKLVVLPSSVHEVLVRKYDESESVDELSAMVREVNDTQVIPEERLANKAFVVDIAA